MKLSRKMKYNKSYLALLLLFLIVSKGYAQQAKPTIGKKDLAGNYAQGGTAGIYVYEDGTFALFGYATLVFGTYQIQENEIDFTPYIPDQAFRVLGRENKSLKTGNGAPANFIFSNKFMTDGLTYIDCGNGFMKVADENFETGEPTYAIDFASKPASITLGFNSEYSGYDHNTETFELDENYNEFLLFYDKTINEQRPFSGTIKTDNGQIELITSWGSFAKNEVEEELMLFINLHKEQHEKNKEAKSFYFNDQLKRANGYNHYSEKQNDFSISNYILDERSNKLIHKDVFKKGKNYSKSKVEEYHNEDIILEYHSVEIKEKTKLNYDKLTISENALF